MTEQYIYSRSEREFTNALNQTIPLGFGFMALSSGIDDTLKRDVKVHCEDCPRLVQTDGRSVPMRFFRKARLPKGQVLLQESTWIEKSSRDFHVAHGYVLDEPALAAGPAKWLAAEFRLEDPNGIPGGVPPLESLSELPGQQLPELHPLRDAALGLGMESYCQLLLACFDAVASRRQVLIAWDFERPGEWELRRSVLYWIYTFLPYDLWTGLGFDSVYTDKSSPGLTHLAFVDRTLIQDRGKTPGIHLGNQLLSLGGNFLVRDGEITHNDGKYKTEWYGRGLPYAAWLKRLVDMVWNSPKERRSDILPTLEDAREKLQHGMRSVPEAKRLNTGVYNKASEQAWNLLEQKETAVAAKPNSSKAAPEPAAVKPESPTVTPKSPMATLRSAVAKPAPQKVTPRPAVVKPAPQKVTPGPAVVKPAPKKVTPRPAVAKPAPKKVTPGPAVVKPAPPMVTSAPPRDRPAAVTAKTPGSSSSEVYQDIFKRRTCQPSPKECSQWMDRYFQDNFGEILSRRKIIPTNSKDIQSLASVQSGWARAVALGILGAFMARDADSPQYHLWAQSGWSVLGYYQAWLQTQPALYSWLLSRLFWNRMSDVEWNAWNKCGVKNSDDAAQKRRYKLYHDILSAYWAYRSQESVVSYATRWIRTISGTISDISVQERTQMVNELQGVVKRNAGFP